MSRRAIWGVVPMKSPRRAKSRLRWLLGDAQTQQLAIAWYRGVVSALLDSGVVDGVAVLSDGPAPDDRTNCHPRVHNVAIDAPGGLPEVVRRGLMATTALGAEAVLVAMADLPMLEAADIRGFAEGWCSDIVRLAPCRLGCGTNLMLTRVPPALRLHFGQPSSLQLHRASAVHAGVATETLITPGAELDVDGPDDVAHWRASAGGEPSSGMEHFRRESRTLAPAFDQDVRLDRAAQRRPVTVVYEPNID